jgi:hypothetical protein
MLHPGVISRDPATLLDCYVATLYLKNHDTIAVADQDEISFTISLPAGTLRLPTDRMKNGPFVSQTPQGIENPSL